MVLFLAMATSLTAAIPDAESIQLAVEDVALSLLSTLAASTSVPQTLPDGVSVESLGDGSDDNVAIVSYLRCDVAQMTDSLSKPPQSRRMSFFQRIINSASRHISPLIRIAAHAKESLGLEEGDAILDGTIVFHGLGPIDSLPSLIFNLYVLRDYEVIDLEVYVSLVVSGDDFPDPLAFEGIIAAEGDNEADCVRLTVEKMTCNNLGISISPMEFGFI